MVLPDLETSLQADMGLDVGDRVEDLEHGMSGRLSKPEKKNEGPVDPSPNRPVSNGPG